MNDSGFRLWRARYVEGYCVVEPPTGIKNSFQLSRGVSRSAGWSKEASCRMSDEFPKDIQLPDCLFGASFVIVSARIRALIESTRPIDVELLPITIVDHKERSVAEDYAIVNPLKVVDAINIDASAVKWNRIKTDLIASCQRIVIDAGRVPPELGLFRLRHLEHRVVVSGELARQLEDAEPIGLALQWPDDYTGS